jgi:hypothetical protein
MKQTGLATALSALLSLASADFSIYGTEDAVVGQPLYVREYRPFS